MARGDNETEGRNRWSSARERERMKARYAVRTRVMGADDAAIKELSRHNEGPVVDSGDLTLSEWTKQDLDILCPLLRHVEAGRSSAFSVSTLASHYTLLNKPFPTRHLSPFKIKTLCTSRFGPEYAQTIQNYVDALETATVMEYAAWLGEYRLLGPMLAGGLDPMGRGMMKQSENKGHDEEEASVRRRSLSARVLRRFFDAFPSSLSSYIVKRVVDMRVHHWKDQCDTICSLCDSRDSNQLSFGSPCNHAFCENCFWQDLVDHVDDRDDGDVVLCPVCGKSGSHTTETSSMIKGDCPADLRRVSLEKYRCLPATSKDLKQLPKRKKYRQNALSSSWREAVAQAVGRSQDIRRDKFFNYTERNAYHYVKGCLELGVDVDWTNKYGQTCLHIAAWRGYIKLVKLLLRYGSDPTIVANGGVSTEHTSKANGHVDVLKLLRHTSIEDGICAATNNNSAFAGAMNKLRETVLPRPALKILISEDTDHSGAGACVIDGGFSSECVDVIVQLWRSLPVDHSYNEKKEQKGGLCSVRSYYCDAEGMLRNALAAAVSRAYETSTSQPRQVFVFPHMRFLYYDQPKSVLAPHVDLSRTESSVCSSHTLIFYLSDCKSGGQTSLLGGLSGDRRNEVVAKVSPQRGRLLLFPHSCPHEGNEVVDVPKVLLRGEVLLSR